MTRREMLIGLALGTVPDNLCSMTSRLGASEPGTTKPNFVFILIDDLGWADAGCYGNQFYETPHIDRLAAEGMKFTDGYAACPVCSPTRASILTGQFPARLHLTDWIPGRTPRPFEKLLGPKFNQQLPLDETTIAEALAPAGYVSASIGKWHLGGKPYYPVKQGFALNFGGTEQGSTSSYFCPYQIATISDCGEGEYLTDRLTVEAEKFIEQYRERPFFLYLAHYTVHIPLQGKEKLIAKYQAKARRLHSQANPVYAAMVESADQSVGRILRKLDDLKIASRTVLIFTSDNGGLEFEGRSREEVTSNAPLRAGKGHLYEGGIREPLIVRWPGVVKPGSVCGLPVTNADFLPTLTDIAGASEVPSKNLDGVSLVPLLKQTGGIRRNAIYWHYPHYSNQGGEPGGAVRDGDYKLIEFYEDGRLELYNLRDDIGEEHNLASSLPEKTQELRAKLHAWRKSVDAQMPSPNPDYDPARANEHPTGWFREH